MHVAQRLVVVGQNQRCRQMLLFVAKLERCFQSLCETVVTWICVIIERGKCRRSHLQFSLFVARAVLAEILTHAHLQPHHDFARAGSRCDAVLTFVF